jgi:RNA polymerase sigma factor (sigma-70 family)
METTEIQELLQAYVQHGSETAFRELVKRYINLVYSTALRQLGRHAQLAGDVAQNVFTDLARKAGKLPSNVLLGGWLHKHTCFVAANFLRSEQRRLNRENQAAQMNSFNDHSDENWKKIAPVLDDAINELNSEDRDAVMLRYFEQRDFRSIGATLGVSDDTAQKRVSRALEKLRGLLVNHGVTLTVTALGTLLTNQSIAFPPSGLAENVAGTAFANAGKSTGGLKSLLSVKTGLVLLSLITVSLFLPSILSLLGNTPSKESKVNSPDIVESRSPADDDGFSSAQNVSPPDTSKNIKSVSAENGFVVPNILTLTVVSAISGRPIPNAPIDFHALTEQWVKKRLTTDRDGVCEVEILPTLEKLELTTQRKGYADTRLTWNVQRGEKIPAKYTLRLEHAVLIGGRVLGPNDEPVADAKVGFGYNFEDPSLRTGTETHEFGYIQVNTDYEGRWQIDRIASDMLRRIGGSADHTNYLSAGVSVSDAGAEEQLRNREYIFRLGKATRIHGFVLDAAQQPISGANVFFGMSGDAGTRETKSAKDGSFTLTGCQSKKDTLTAEAKGFATSAIQIDSSASSGPFQLKLISGRTLRLRVVDKNENSIPGATVMYDTLPNSFNDASVPQAIQASFHRQTDGDGRLVWQDAPEGELQFLIYKESFMTLRGLKIPANDVEHVITLSSGLVVSGTVKNNEGELIPRFRIICGYPQKSRANPLLEWTPSWSGFNRDWFNFSGGSYQHTFQDSMSSGGTNPGYLLKFEAEGYAPLASRIIAADEEKVELNIVLKKANTPTITVSLPDGRVAAQAKVGYTSPGVRLKIDLNGLSEENSRYGGSQFLTDERGQFKLSPDDTITRILITCAEGFAERTPAELIAQPMVHLQSWGTLEGIFPSEEKPDARHELFLEAEKSGPYNITYGSKRGIKTDSEGRFVFSKILPGKYTLAEMLDHESEWFKRSRLQEVTVRSGETTEVTIEKTESGLQKETK